MVPQVLALQEQLREAVQNGDMETCHGICRIAVTLGENHSRCVCVCVCKDLGLYGQTWKSHEIKKNCYFQAWKSQLNPKSFVKVMEIYYIHMFFYAVLTKRLNIYIHIYSLKSNYCLSFICHKVYKIFSHGNSV